MPTPWARPDTDSRCQAFSSVSRPRNLEGPVPGPGIGRLGLSPALRTAARVGLTRRIEPCSPDGRPQGTSLRRWCSSRFRPSRLPQPMEASGRFTRNPNPRRGRSAPRTDTWRWQPELTASQPTACNSYPQRTIVAGGSVEKQHGNPDSLTHRVHLAERSHLLRNIHPTGWSQQHGSGCPPTAAARLPDKGRGAVASTCSGSQLATTAGRTLDVAPRCHQAGSLKPGH